MNERHVSRFLSLVLRHQPELIGIELDAQGWTAVDVLLERMAAHDDARLAIGLEDLERIVASDEKGRYALRDGAIRANQGHSVPGIDPLDGIPREPPARLYHGTTEEDFGKIRESGALLRMSRHHVHLSADAATATAVGSRRRRKTLLVLEIDAARMHADGFVFYRSENGVWHCDEVPLAYVTVAS